MIRSLLLAEALCYQTAILQRHEIETRRPSFHERDLLEEMARRCKRRGH